MMKTGNNNDLPGGGKPGPEIAAGSKAANDVAKDRPFKRVHKVIGAYSGDGYAAYPGRIIRRK